MKYKDICPKCFCELGFSVPLEEERGIFNCTKKAAHRFKKNKDGFFEFYKG
jgi:hypothetical protein